MLVEHTYTCCSCGETIVTAVDPSAGSRQDYVEDCPVCCRPHTLRVRVDGDHVEIDAELEE